MIRTIKVKGKIKPYSIPVEEQLSFKDLKLPMVVENYYTGELLEIMAEYGQYNESHPDNTRVIIREYGEKEIDWTSFSEVKSKHVRYVPVKQNKKEKKPFDPYKGSGKYKGD